MTPRFKLWLESYFRCPEQASLLDALRPMSLILTALGLQPYRLRFDPRRRKLERVRNSLYTNALCAVSVAIFLLSSFLVHVHSILVTGKSFSISDVILTQLNYIAELLSISLVCVVSFVNVYSNSSLHAQILNDVSKAHYKINFGAHNYSSTHTKARFLTTVALPFILLVHLIVNFTRDDGWWKTFLVTTSFILPQIIQFCIIFHIQIQLSLVISLIRCIGKALTDYNPDKQNYNLKKVVSKDPLQLSQMKAVYSDSFEISKKINTAFAAPILMTIASCFHSIISEGYILYHGIAESAMTVHQIVNCGLWIVWQCGKIYLVGATGNRLKTEAAEVGQHLHNIPTEDESLRTLIEIQNFSSQVLHQKTELTVYGYFPLDSTLLYNMVGAAAMYFVILVQLDLTRT